MVMLAKVPIVVLHSLCDQGSNAAGLRHLRFWERLPCSLCTLSLKPWTVLHLYKTVIKCTQAIPLV